MPDETHTIPTDCDCGARNARGESFRTLDGSHLLCDPECARFGDGTAAFARHTNPYTSDKLGVGTVRDHLPTNREQHPDPNCHGTVKDCICPGPADRHDSPEAFARDTKDDNHIALCADNHIESVRDDDPHDSGMVIRSEDAIDLVHKWTLKGAKQGSKAERSRIYKIIDAQLASIHDDEHDRSPRRQELRLLRRTIGREGES